MPGRIVFIFHKISTGKIVHYFVADPKTPEGEGGGWRGKRARPEGEEGFPPIRA